MSIAVNRKDENMKVKKNSAWVNFLSKLFGGNLDFHKAEMAKMFNFENNNQFWIISCWSRIVLWLHFWVRFITLTSGMTDLEEVFTFYTRRSKQEHER